MLVEEGHGLVGRLEEAVGLGLDRERHGRAGPPLQIDEMGRHAKHVLRVRRDDIGSRHVRLEAERSGLDRRLHAGCADLGEDVGDVHRVARALLAAPVRLVDLLLDADALERPVRERVDRVEVEVVLGKKGLEPFALLRIGREGLGRGVGEPQRYAERRIGRDPRLHLRHVRRQAPPHLVPRVTRMDERRICQVAEAVTEVHVSSAFSGGQGTRSTAPELADRTIASVTAAPWIIWSTGMG